MNNKKVVCPNDLAKLIRTLLKVDPEALETLGRKSGASADPITAGLHEFLRAVLEQALGLLRVSGDQKVLLQAGSSEVARIHNLIQWFALALAREPRRMRGLTDLAVYECDANVVQLPMWGKKHRAPLLDSLALTLALFQSDFDVIRDAPAPRELPFSAHTKLCAMLGVPPQTLVRLYYDSRGDAERAFAADPDGQSFAGLAACLLRVTRHVPLILSQQIDTVRFAIVSDSAQHESSGGATAMNFAALLTYGLLADGTRDLGFVTVG